MDVLLSLGVGITIGLIWKALRHKRTGAVPLFVGMVLFAAFILHDIGSGLGILKTEIYLANFGLATFIFFQGQTVAQLFAKAFRTAQNLTEHLEEEVDKKTRDIQSLLDNLPLGICSLNQDARIMPNYSSQMNEVLADSSFENRDVIEAIFSKSSLSSDSLDVLKQCISSSVGEEVLSFELNAAHFPQEIQLNIQGKAIYLQCIWSPITDRNAKVARILLVLRDVSNLKKSELQRLEHQRELEYIIELVNVTPVKFQSFVLSATQLLGENDRLIRQNSIKDPEIVKIIFINMHTIKGGARTLGLLKLTALLHEVEQIYSSLLKDDSTSWQQKRRLQEMIDVKTLLDYYIQLNFGKLGRVASNTAEVSVERDQLERHNQTLRSIEVSKMDPRDVQKLHNTISEIENLCFDDAADVFLDILSNVHRVAKDLGKEKPDISVEAQGFKLTPEAQKLLSNVFVHIIRNSLDHGIENANERIASGKRPTGRINVRLVEKDGKLEIVYKDDGRGLNIQKLRAKAEKDNLLPIEQRQDLKKIAGLIFLPGLSTAQSLTEVSGRGIGMDAVKRYIEERNGSIDLDVYEEVNGYAPFAIRLRLNADLFIKSISIQAKTG